MSAIRRSRLSLLRVLLFAGALTGGALGSAPMNMGGTQLELGAAAASGTLANDEIHWSITGPTSVSFNWRGPDNTLRYGPTPDYGFEVTAGMPVPYPFSSAGPFWEARLTGLQENTTYHYRIGNGPNHTFRTPPPRGSATRFTVYAEGDIGESSSDKTMPVVQSLIGWESAFVLLVGDLTYANAHGQEHVDQFFNDVMTWSQEVAAMPAWGNHETDKLTNACGLTCGEPCATQTCDDLRNYKGRWDLPNPQTSPGSPAVSAGPEDWYWFDYDNVRFIVYPEPWSGAWADWSTQAAILMDGAQGDPAINFIVTYGHRPSYSSGHHPGNAKLKGFLDALGASHSKYVLDLAGHSHNYERSYPQSGVTHLTVGTGGAGLEQDGSCLWLTCAQPSWSAFRAFYLGVLKLDFYSTSIQGSFICGPAGSGVNEINGVRTTCTPGSVIDRFVIGEVPSGEPEGVIETPAGNVTIPTGGTVDFTSRGSTPGSYLPLTFAWDFGGAAPSLMNTQNPGVVRFQTPGIYRVTLTVANSLGITDPTPDTRLVTVFDRAPDGTIDSPAGAVTIGAGQSVVFAGTGTDPDGDTALKFAWSFGGGAANATVEDPGAVTFNTPGMYTTTFTVTDSWGVPDPTPDIRLVTVTSAANLVGNPSFEVDTSGWAPRAGTSVERVAGGHSGGWALRVGGTSGNGIFGLNDSPNWVSMIPAAGTRYRVTAWVRSDDNKDPVRLRIREYLNGNLVGLPAISEPFALTVYWQQVNLGYVALQQGSTLDLQILETPVAASESFQIDDVSILVVP